MASPSLPRSADEYLRIDRESEFNNEFIFGEIFPMVGGSPAHSTITGNAYYEFRVQLAGDSFRAYNTSLRVCLDRPNLYAYPDMTVVCGELEYIDAEEDTIINPKVVVEVLSPSTKNYDLGRTSVGIEESPRSRMLFIGQKNVGIEHWFRAAGGDWAKRVLDHLQDALRIDSVNCEIPVSGLYADVKFSR